MQRATPMTQIAIPPDVVSLFTAASFFAKMNRSEYANDTTAAVDGEQRKIRYHLRYTTALGHERVRVLHNDSREYL